MKKYEISFPSTNSATYPKMITVLIIAPDKINSETGAMLFTHGWGGSRFQHQDKMEYTVELFNLACISVEYRQSGYDFDPVKGLGAYLPYDASFYQVADVLNGLREVLTLHPAIDRSRLFHYGGSQGGHIALLSSIFAPDTFAFVYSSCALVKLTEDIQSWAGRTFADFELSVRNVTEHAAMIQCPLFMEHGTADVAVPHCHAEELEKRLRELGKTLKIKYYEGGDHGLEPTISKLEAFKAMAPEPMQQLKNSRPDNFMSGNKIKIDCGSKILVIDWSLESQSPELLKWESKKLIGISCCAIDADNLPSNNS